MSIRLFLVVSSLVFVFSFRPTFVQAHSVAQPTTLTSTDVQRALQLARWLWSQSPQKKPFLHRDMPLLNLEQWLITAAVLERTTVYKSLLKKARQLGYKAIDSELLHQWQHQWRKVLLAADAMRWKVTPTHRAGLLQQLTALPKKRTQTQTLQRRAWLYKLTLSNVSVAHKNAVRPFLSKLNRFFAQLWLPASK